MIGELLLKSPAQLGSVEVVDFKSNITLIKGTLVGKMTLIS